MRIRVSPRETRQVVYISENTSGFYLSKSALRDLDLIHQNFSNQTSEINMSVTANGKALCGCSQRTMIPDELTNIPFPPVEINRNRLERWLWKCFRSDMFNMFPHQSLQGMIGRPLDITFVQGATSSVVHTPIPVPHHWKKKVKQDLN